MKKSDCVTNVKEAFQKLEKKYVVSHFNKYVIAYNIEDNKHLRIISNVGETRVVKNTRSNVTKLNQVIVKNKVMIANKIDKYESTSKERSSILIINALIEAFAGGLVLLSFFSGIYWLFIAAIIAFSVSTTASSILGFTYYLEVREIQNLKNVTGYKKEVEFHLPKIDTKLLKSRN